MLKVNIWDLDGTVINSFHRVSPCLDKQGNLNLERYKTYACKHELIQQDTLLPLVELMRRSMGNKDEVNYIVTARLMSRSDYYYLRKQGLRGRGKDNIQVFSRDTLHKFIDSSSVKDIYHSSDAKYKEHYFNLIKNKHGDALYTVYDDHKGVLQVARDMGFNAVDATLLNDYFDVAYKIAGEEILNDIMDNENDIDFLSHKIESAWSNLLDEEKEYYSVKYPKLLGSY